MKTGDFNRALTSSKLNETFEKNFGGQVNIEDYTREDLEDLRNRVRTMVFQQESTAGYNDLLTNETYQKNQAMLQLLNTRIKEMLGEDIKKLRDKMDQLSEAKAKPDANKNGIPDYAEDGKGKKDLKKKAKDVAEANDGNLANNAKPYDKVTRGDVVAGRLGKDAQGGKKDKVAKETAEKTSERDIEMKKQGGGTVKVKATQYKGHQSKAADKDAKKDQEFEETLEIEEASTGDYSAKKGAAGKDLGKPGKNFKKIADKSSPEVAGAVLKKLRAKKESIAETNASFKHNVKFVNESLVFLINEDEEGKAKAITAASDIVNDFTTWMQRVGQYQTKSMIELADSIKANFGAQEAEQFKTSVAASLSQTLEVLTSQREAISGAVAVLAGEATPEAPMGQDPSMAGGLPPEDPAMDMTPPDEMNPEPVGDEFAGAEGPSSNREVRESREQTRARKLAEAHSIISKLAR
jgi:hypothetical protein